MLFLEHKNQIFEKASLLSSSMMVYILIWGCFDLYLLKGFITFVYLFLNLCNVKKYP